MRQVTSVLPQVSPHSLLPPGKEQNVYKFLKLHISFSVVEVPSGRGGESKSQKEGNTVRKGEREKQEKWTKEGERENKESRREKGSKRTREARK